ncbi:MAG: hypothetical protein AB7U20_04270 [Planctomycetaceae bacterium]
MSGLAGLAGGRPLSKFDALHLKLKSVKSDEEKEAVTKELRDALLTAFDADMRQRQAELDKIKQRVAAMEAELEKRTAAKDDIVALRLQVLVNDAAGLGWSDNARGGNRLNVFSGEFGFGRGSLGRGGTTEERPSVPADTETFPFRPRPAGTPSGANEQLLDPQLPPLENAR